MNTPMTPEQKIIAIAEFEGWTCYKGQWWKPNETRVYANLVDDAPPYLTSRDAICGAVARLDSMEFFYFVEHLERICGTDGWEIMTSDDMRRILLATPTQLADALLLTLGYEI